MDLEIQNDFEQFQKLKAFPHISYSILVTIGIVLLMAFGQAGLLIIIPDHLKDLLKPYAIGITQIALMLIPVLFAAEKSPLTTKDIFRLNYTQPTSFYIFSILGLCSIQFFFFGWLVFQDSIVPLDFKDEYELLKTEFESIYKSILAGESEFEFIRAIIIGALIPAVSEELLFRGFLQRSLEVKLTPFWAIVISSIIFGFIHFNPINLVPLVVIGLLLGYIAYVTRSIVIPIILHFINNTIAIIGIYNTTAENFGKSLENMEVNLAVLVGIGALLITLSFIYLLKISSKNYYSNQNKVSS